MSGFQTYLDNAEKLTGITPAGFVDRVRAAGLADERAGAIVSWLKAEHGLGHGHAANLAQLVVKGPDVVAVKYNGGAPLRLDGLAAAV